MAGFYGIDNSREVIRVHVKKCDGLMQPDVKKFSIDPQITSFEMLQNILAKAFDIKSDFTISYLSKDNSPEVYLSMLSDWDMDAAFQNASDPCLRLKVDLKPFDEGLEDWDIIAPVEIPQFRMAFLDKGSFLGNITGNISNHLGRTVSQVQKVIGIKSDDGTLYKPIKAPMNDHEFRNYLDSDGHMVKPEEFRLSIYQGGVEPALRRVVWRHLLNIYPEDLSGRERFDYMKKKENEYFKLRDNWKDLFTQRQVTDEAKHVASLVKKDVLRTDRTHKFYAGGDESKNLISLYNLLVTYALTHPEVSYCQGMSDIASPLLVVQKEEAQAYLCFCGLMNRLRSNFLYNGEAITTKLQHLSALVHFYDPVFHVYMKEHGAEDLFFCYRWLLLEMKREFPFEDALYMLEVMWSTLPPDPPEGGLCLKDPDYSPAFMFAMSPHSPTVALKQTQYSHLLAKRRTSVTINKDIKDIAGPQSPKVLVSPKFREALLKESAKGSGSELTDIQEDSKESESNKAPDQSLESRTEQDHIETKTENEKDSGNEKDHDETETGFDDVDSGCDFKKDWMNQTDETEKIIVQSENNNGNHSRKCENEHDSTNSKVEEANTSTYSKIEDGKNSNDSRNEIGRCSDDSRSESGRCSDDSRSENGRCFHDSRSESGRCSHDSRRENVRCSHDSRSENGRCSIDSRSEDGRYSRDSRSIKDDSPDKFESANTSMASSLSNSYSVERFPSLISGSIEDFVDDEELEVISSSERYEEPVDIAQEPSETEEQALFHLSLDKTENETLKKKSTIPQIKGSFFSGMKKILSSPIRRPAKAVKVNGNGNVVGDNESVNTKTVRSQSCNCLSSGVACAAKDFKNRSSCYDAMGISPEGDSSVEHTLFEVNLATSCHGEKQDRDSGNGSLTSSTNSSHMPLTKLYTPSQNNDKAKLRLNIQQADGKVKDKNAKNRDNEVAGSRVPYMKNGQDEMADDRYPTFCENHFDIDNGDTNRTDEAKDTGAVSECMEVIDSQDEVLRLKQLPAPELFGYGNPFLMFICLTVLLQHRDMVIKAGMEYDEMAMFFDKMVRKHNVHKVLHQARQLYTDYIRMQQSAIAESKSDPDFKFSI